MFHAIRSTSRLLAGVLVLVPWLAGCPGNLDQGIWNTDIQGTGGAGSGGSTSTGGMIGSGGSSSTGGAIGSGGSGAGTGGGTGTMTSCDAPGTIFHDSSIGCLGGGCHSSGQQAPDLSGSDGSVLKGMKSTILCGGGDLVIPSDPTSSVLYKVLAGSSCLIQMRVGGPYLNSDQLKCVADWIGNIQ